MGGGSWSSSAWGGYAQQNVSGKSQAQMFSSHLNEAVDPLKFTNGIRESVDGPDNPLSTPVAIFTDMTGSMGVLAETVVKKLDVVCQSLLDRKPVSDPHLLTGVVGDAYSDSAPFQATQFEADIRIAQQTQMLYLERNGGGNGGESYAMPWLFAGMMTAIDSYDKRGKKGYLFTVGDEPIHGVTNHGPSYRGMAAAVTKAQAKRVLGLDIERDFSAEECLELARRKFNVFHIVISQGSSYRSSVIDSFGKLMPDNLLFLESIEELPELIVSTIEVSEGRDAATVAASWGGNTAVVIAKALNGLATVKSDSDQDVVAL